MRDKFKGFTMVFTGEDMDEIIAAISEHYYSVARIEDCNIQLHSSRLCHIAELLEMFKNARSTQ